MDPSLERIRQIQAVGQKLAKAYRDYGHPRWRAVLNCNSGVTVRGGAWVPAGLACRDRFCPRCGYTAMLRYTRRLQSYMAGELYFITYTWRQGLDNETVEREILTRNNLVKYFSGKDLCWKSEFTLRANGLLHHHVHTIQKECTRVEGFNAPWQNVQIEEFDGRLAELVKYLAKPDSFDYIAPVAKGLFKKRVPMRGCRGFQVEEPDFNEWPIVVEREGLQEIRSIIIHRENQGVSAWQGIGDGAEVIPEECDVVDSQWVESFFGPPESACCS